MPLRVVPRRDRKLYRAVKAAPVLAVRRGEVLWERGDAAELLLLVRRGHARLVAPGKGGVARTIHVVGPWEMTGEEALVGAAARRYRAVAGEAMDIQWLDAGRVTSVLRTSRVTREAFLEAVQDDLQALGHRAAGSGHPDAGGRLASVLLDLAARLGAEGEERPTVSIGIIHRTLADLAGLHRSTVTTQMNDWLYRGWIAETDPGFRIDDPERLRRIAGLLRDPAARRRSGDASRPSRPR